MSKSVSLDEWRNFFLADDNEDYIGPGIWDPGQYDNKASYVSYALTRTGTPVFHIYAGDYEDGEHEFYFKFINGARICFKISVGTASAGGLSIKVFTAQFHFGYKFINGDYYNMVTGNFPLSVSGTQSCYIMPMNFLEHDEALPSNGDFIIFGQSVMNDINSGLPVSLGDDDANGRFISRGLTNIPLPDEVYDELINGNAKPDYPGEGSFPEGGDGSYYAPNEVVGWGGFPSIQPIDFGFTSIYHVDKYDMQDISQWLWGNDFEQNIKKNYISPFDNIVGLTMCCIPTNLIETEPSALKIGNVELTGHSFNKVINEYVELYCGYIDVNEYWQSFLDYEANYTIFLPYIGYRSLKTDDILHGRLEVKYNIDLLTGSAVCQIASTSFSDGVFRVLYTFPCNIYYNVAISGANFMSMYNQQLSATVHGLQSAANIVTSAATKDAGGVLNGVLGAVMANREYKTAKPDYSRGGNNGGNSGSFSIRHPYIIQSLPIQRAPDNYRSLQGVPSMITRQLKNLSGYTEIECVVVDTLNHCSPDEKDAILNMLKGGVYL